MSKQEEIKQALAAATPGPWKVYRSKLGKHEETLIGTEYDHPQLKAPDSIVGHAFGVGVEYTYIREADADLIAKAPEYIAYLLEENEKRLLEAQDWEDEYHAMKRRYEELDRSALEKHELLMDTTAKFQAVSKELEEYGTLIEQQGKEMIRLQQLANKQGKDLEESRKQSAGVRRAMQDVLYYLQRDSYIPAQDILEQYLAFGQEGEGNQ
ncbi:hypothetical protein [Paenibacillus polysaccharolyticus]|uniref:hypothetical protein n=1 Tax=Paenibacillus polysaccharolyticus TaxID=582692 RepID=UPI0030089632